MGLFGEIGRFFGAGGDKEPEKYQVERNLFTVPDQDKNKAMLAQAAADASKRQAPLSQMVYTAPQLDRTRLAQAQQGQAAQGPAGLDTAQSDQLRSAQMQLIAAQQAQVAGQGGSVAEQQLRQGAEANLRAQMAQAASVRGNVNPALAARQFASQAADAGQATNAQAALLRAQEQNMGTQALAQTLTSGRSQDLSVAAQNAALAQQNAQLQQQTGLANQSAANQFALQQGQMDQATAMQRAQYDQQAQQLMGAQAQFNAQSQLQQQGQNDAMRQYAMSGQMGIAAQQAAANQNMAGSLQSAFDRQQQAQLAQSAAQSGFGQNLFGQVLGGAVGGAMLFSDERLKTDVDRKGVSSDVQQLLDAVDPASYRYRDPAHGEGRRWGVMAQSLQATPAGAALVKDTGQGLAIDTATGFGTLLAAAKDLHERTKRLEAKGRPR